MCRLIATWSVILGVLSGTAITLNAGFGLAVFDGIRYVPGLATLSIARVLATGATSTGTVLGIVHWSHRYDSVTLKSSVTKVLVFGILGAITMTPFVGLLALFASFVSAKLVFGIAWSFFVGGVCNILTAEDGVVGLLVGVGSALVLVPILALALPGMARKRWGLATKLVTVWGTLMVLSLATRLFFG